MDEKRTPARTTPASRLADADGDGWTPAGSVAPIGYHLIARLADDRVIAPSAVERRELASVVYEQGESRGLVLFRAADTHLHIVAACDRETAGDLARYTLMSLRWRLRLTVAFEPCRVKPIVDQRHLENMPRYGFRQEEHHGIACDPFHDASSLVDLLGLRQLGPRTTARFKALLPRMSLQSLATLSGIPMSSAATIQPELLAEAALSAAGLPRFAHNSLSKQARCAAAHSLAAPTGQIAALLGVTQRTIRRLRATPPNPALLASIKAQLLMRSASGAPPTIEK